MKFFLLSLLLGVVLLGVIYIKPTTEVVETVDEATIEARKAEVLLLATNINNYCKLEKVKQQLDPNLEIICINGENIKNNISKIHSISKERIVELDYSNDRVNLLIVKYDNQKYIYSANGDIKIESNN